MQSSPPLAHFLPPLAVSSPDKQQTLARPASLSGVSLHTGEKVNLTLRPAAPDSGIKFKRLDLPDEPTIDARIDNVKTVERATTLGEGSVKVHTVEHVLSALTGMNIDNAVVEMDANEPPIGDGSALAFLELIRECGVAPQDAARRVFEVREPVHIETKTGSLISLVPDDKYRISCTQVGPQGRFTQFLSLEITPEIYEKEIAPARTFTFYEDVQPLMEKGLIKGGSLENAIVVRGDSVLSRDPLRFPDEFVRHKILDIVGDLALFGRRIKGHVIAIKPGHGPNAELTRALAKQQAQMVAMIPAAVTVPHGDQVLDINEVMRMLPHRYPFLMVDRVIGFEGENKCTAVKQVTINEPFFQGHFPGYPVMPGVLQVEAIAQVASILILRQPEHAGKLGFFMSADNVKFRKPVLPGDTLIIHVEMLKARRGILRAIGHCMVNGALVSEAEIMLSVFQR
jgi:UDP-3-O-[3-hydroxymyristoyl] N-acetylglucosamine deacetylase/3-hydroxyacyl-[acyl-carrier-protein] dehydratase